MCIKFGSWADSGGPQNFPLYCSELMGLEKGSVPFLLYLFCIILWSLTLYLHMSDALVCDVKIVCFSTLT